MLVCISSNQPTCLHCPWGVCVFVIILKRNEYWLPAFIIHSRGGRGGERKWGCKATEERKIDGKRRRDTARESKRAWQHERVYLTLHTPPQRSRIRPVKEPNLFLPLSLCVRKQEHLTTTTRRINPSCKMPSKARLKVCWLRVLFKAHQRMEMQGNKVRGDALKIWQECDSPTEKGKERER